jgi:hypothetical protein
MLNSGKSSPGAGKPDRVNWQGNKQGRGGEAQHQWQQDPQRQRRLQAARANRPRRLKLAAASLTAVALLGALVYFLLIGSPATPLLAIAITGYAAPLPPNAWAKEDIDRFDRFQSPTRSFRNRGAIDPETHSDQDEWFDPGRSGDLIKKLTDWLNRAKPGGPGRNAVVIYLSGHGVVDDEGEPCLVLPQKGGPSGTPRRAPWDTSRWLRVRDLVAALDAERPNVRKVILLDANRIDVQWSMGVLGNGFAAALPRALKDAETVAAINSASPGEKAWAAPEWQASFFGDSVLRALAGAADGALDGRRNKTVTFEELAAFLHDDVRGLVAENRSDRQTPLAINGLGRDFDVVRVDEVRAGDPDNNSLAAPDEAVASAGKQGANPTKQAGSWTAIGKMWQLHERWRPWAKSSASGAGGPWLTFQLFEQRLLRWEQELLAGDAYRDAAGKSEAAARSLAKQLQASLLVAPPAHSLPLLEVWNPEGPNPQSKDAQSAAEAFARLLDDDRPAGENAAGETAADAQQERKLEPHQLAPYASRAAIGWKWLADEARRPTLERLRRFHSLVGQPDEGRLPLAEAHFVELLLGESPTSTSAPRSIWDQTGDFDDVRAALRARELAEQAAAPRDERALYALRPAADQADALRRQADDQLFVGRPEALADARDKWRKATDAYQQAIALGEELADCFAARDRAWSQLAHWGQHVDRRWRYSSELNQVRDVSGAMNEARQLAEALERYQQARQSGEGKLSEALDQAQQRRDKLTQIMQALDTSAGSLLGRARDAQKIRDIESLLGGPLVTGNQRAEMHRELQAWINERATVGRGGAVGDHMAAASNRKPATLASATNQPTGSGANEETARGRGSIRPPWEIHPALLLLTQSDAQAGSASPSPSTDDDGLAAVAGEVRKKLTHLDAELARLLTREAPAADAPVVWKARENLSLADRRARPVAAFWVWPSAEAQPDPVGRLAQFDRSQFLAWHCDRVLTDFWGPSERKDTPYFAQVFRAYQTAARLLPADPSLPGQWKQLDDRGQQLLTSLTDEVWPIEDQSPARFRATGIEKTVSLHQAAYPPGTAALLARDPDDHPAAVVRKDADDDAAGDRLAVEISGQAGPWPTSGEPLDVVLQTGGASAAGQSPEGVKPGSWKLIWLYRGHQRPFQVEAIAPGQGMELVYQPAKAGKATIRVRGEAKQPGCVVFVLDCSGSMSENGRMGVAKADLKQIAAMLADSGQYEVGLWFYGHRVGVQGPYMKDKRTPNPDAGKLTPNPNWRANRKWWGDVDDTLAPANDVQSVLAVRRLDRETLADFNAAIDTAMPYGQTPLYRAMIAAAQDDLAHQPRDLPRRLVVITDGVNSVSNAGSAPVTSKDVRVAFQDRSLKGVQLDIVGVELAKNLKNSEKASFNELRDLDDKQGIRYYPAERLDRLIEKLREALQLRRYQVVAPDDSDAAEAKEINIGQPVEVRTDSAKKRRVSIAGEAEAKSDVEVRGDETLELYLDKQGTRLRLVHAPRGPDREFERYGIERQPNERLAAREVANPGGRPDSDFNPLKLFVAAYRPSRGAGTRIWKFPITVQNAEPDRFSPRPAEAWIDVTPLAESGGQTFDTYPVYDVSYEPHLPVPVIECALSRWPEAATKAEIRVWLKLTATPPRQEVSLRDAVTNRVLVDGGKRGSLATEIADATADDDRSVVRVTEQQGGEGPPRWLKIELSETPSLVRRTFYHAGRYAVHEFYFPNRAREDLSKAALFITPRDDLERGAVAISEQPLEVSLPR